MYNARTQQLIGPVGAHWDVLLDRLIYIARRLNKGKDQSVWLALLKLCNQEAKCNRTVAQIALHARCTSRTVHASLVRLEALGFIERHSTKGKPNEIALSVFEMQSYTMLDSRDLDAEVIADI